MSIHKAVLLEESIEGLNIKKGDTAIDATLGGGGHSREILKIIGSKGKLVAIDRDRETIESFVKFTISNSSAKGGSVSSWQFPNNFQLSIFKIKNNYFINNNFADLDSILKALKIENVNAVLADFGISSDQLGDAKRGFSFQENAHLDMRMGRCGLYELRTHTKLRNVNYSNEITAEHIVNNYSEEKLKKIFWEYGEEKYSREIAKAIIASRKIRPIKKTLELVGIIESAIPARYKRGRKHFATKTFQALRIEVNNELENIKRFLPPAIDALKRGGRLAVISFHSGEDRIVKEIFRENARGCICPPEFPICRCGRKPKIKIITQKPIISSSEEIKKNQRSRSAKLRIAERL